MLVGKTRLIPFIFIGGLFCWGLLYLAIPPSVWHMGGGYDTYPRHPHAPPPPPNPWSPSASSRPHTEWDSRADQVKEAFLHAWQGYQRYAKSHDELKPLSNSWDDNFNAWGLQVIDALDTMWIMGLRDQFSQTMPFVADMTFNLTETHYAPFFETVIRYLGGLLSAYALSAEPILLSRADDLGKMLLPAFNTTTGLPMYAINTVTGATTFGWARDTTLWSEAMSCQLEYKYLAHLTGRHEYFDKVEKIMDIMHVAKVQDGKFPTKWGLFTGVPTNKQFSVGAFADSAHEYLLKQWLMTSKSETKAKDLYLRVVDSIITNLLYLSPNRNLLYVTDTYNDVPSHAFEHLSCFLPGLLILGANTLSLSEHEKQVHSWAAEGLANTCYLMYADQSIGLGPDVVVMAKGNYNVNASYLDDSPESQLTPITEGRWFDHLQLWEAQGKPGGIPPGLEEIPPTVENQDYVVRDPGYFLRPETVESLYYMWRMTGNEKWRERGWEVFKSLQRYTRTTYGYASLTSVTVKMPQKKDEMPSFFMAETLKYLYLLFTEEELIPIDKWVFNTEAHPLPVFQWSDWEKERYHIA